MINIYFACVWVALWIFVLHGSCLIPQFSIFLINPPVSNIDFATSFKIVTYSA